MTITSDVAVLERALDDGDPLVRDPAELALGTISAVASPGQ